MQSNGDNLSTRAVQFYKSERYKETGIAACTIVSSVPHFVFSHQHFLFFLTVFFLSRHFTRQQADSAVGHLKDL